MIKAFQKIIKGIEDPYRILPYLKSTASVIPYYVGDGSNAFYPQIIYLSVNNICNAYCVMCDIGLKNKESSFYQNLIQTGDNSLAIETLNKFINDVKVFKPLIHINATEPLIYKDILTATELIKKSGLGLGITTNGLLLQKYAKELVRLGVDTLCVSLDGLEELHDKIRGRGIFRRAISGIELVKEYRKEYSSTHPVIRINYTISTLNYEKLFDFADFMVNKAGVDFLSFSHLNFVTEAMSEKQNKIFSYFGRTTPTCIKIIDPSKVNTKVLWDQIQEIKDKLDCSKIIFIPEIPNAEMLYKFYNQSDFIVGKKKCIVPWQSATLQPNGDMIILHRCFSYKVGNINDSPFNDIWHGTLYRKFRKELRSNKLFPICTRCCGVL